MKLLRAIVLLGCVYLSVVYGILPTYEESLPPRDARVSWNVVNDGRILLIEGCAVDSDDNCNFHFYNSKFKFLPNENRTLIGARNQLHVLDDNFNSVKKVFWRYRNENFAVCLSVQSESQQETDCQNYIKFIERYPGDENKMLLCGTYSLYRACLVVEADLILNDARPRVNLSVDYPIPNILTAEEAFFAGRASDDNLLGFMKNGNESVLFSAAPSIRSNSDYRISFINATLEGSNPTKINLKPREYVNNQDSQFLQSPVEFRQFFHSNFFNATSLNDGLVDTGIKNYTFLLFNEEAYEDNGGEKSRYARLGRICSNDKGVTHFDRTFFRTFVKARLLCQVETPGGSMRHQGRVYNYNRIMSGHLHHGTAVGSGTDWVTERVFYGAFSGHGLGPKGSAICVYNATRSPAGVKQDNHGFIDIFSGDYYRQDSSSPDANKNPFNCSEEPRSKEEALTHTLIHRPALPIFDAPMVILDGYIISHIVVDTTPIISGFDSETKNFSIGIQDVIFVAVDDGSIIKLYTNSSAPSVHTGRVPDPIFAEVLELRDEKPISDLVIKGSGEERGLYVLSYSSAYRLPLHRCARFSSCSQCVGARDPYCFWDLRNGLCTTLPANVAHITDRFVQNLFGAINSSLVCPLIDSVTETISPSMSSTEIPNMTPTVPPNTGALSPSNGCVDSGGSFALLILGILFFIVGCSLALVSVAALCQAHVRKIKACKMAQGKDVERISQSSVALRQKKSKSHESFEPHRQSKSSTLTSEDVHNCVSVYVENEEDSNGHLFADTNIHIGNGSVVAMEMQSNHINYRYSASSNCFVNNNNSSSSDRNNGTVNKRASQENGSAIPYDNSHMPTSPRTHPVIIVPKTPPKERSPEIAIDLEEDLVPDLQTVPSKASALSHASSANGESFADKCNRMSISTEFDHLEGMGQSGLLGRRKARNGTGDPYVGDHCRDDVDDDDEDQLTIDTSTADVPSIVQSEGSMVLLDDLEMRCDSAA